MKARLSGNSIAKIYTAIDKVGESGITMSSLLVAYNLQINKKAIESIFNAIVLLGKSNKEYMEYRRKGNALQREYFNDHKKLKEALAENNKKYSKAIESEECRLDKYQEELEKEFEVEFTPINRSEFEGTTAESAAFIIAVEPFLIDDKNETK